MVAEARAAGTEVAAHEMGMALRAELAAAAAAAAAARAQDVAALGEAQSLAQKKLADEMRWLDEEHMRCRAEDQARTLSTPPPPLSPLYHRAEDRAPP